MKYHIVDASISQIIDRRPTSETWSWRSVRGDSFVCFFVRCFGIHFCILKTGIMGRNLIIQVKQHIFFKDINWDTLARQKVLIAPSLINIRMHSSPFKVFDWPNHASYHFLQAAFVPTSESALDTSYFTSRYSWNTSDDRVYPASDFEDSSEADSLSGSSCLSNRPEEAV